MQALPDAQNRASAGDLPCKNKKILLSLQTFTTKNRKNFILLTFLQIFTTKQTDTHANEGAIQNEKTPKSFLSKYNF